MNHPESDKLFQNALPGALSRIGSVLKHSTTLYTVLLDRDGLILWTNNTFTELLNGGDPLLIGHKITEFITTTDIDRIKGYLAGTEPWPDESVLVNFLPDNLVPQTLRCSFVPATDVTIFFAEPMLKDNRLLQEELLQLNNQLTVLSRENTRRGRELEKSVRILSAEIEQRKRAETELLRHRNHLEELVQERTTELETARDAAEAASRAKSNFLSTMSHELRTPMNAIIGMSHIIRHDSCDTVLQQRLDKVLEAAKNLLSIINNTLAFSRMETGTLWLETAEFELGKVIHEVCDVTSKNARKKGLEFRVDMASLPEKLYGDGGRLAQILLNYCSNAIKFTERGSITLSGRVKEQIPGTVTIRFEVADTGIGLDEEQQRHLFRAFEQIDGSSTRAYGGTGLGLAICRRLAELMGGTAGLDSVPEKGSTFWLLIPFGVVAAGESKILYDANLAQSEKPVHAENRIPALPENVAQLEDAAGDAATNWPSIRETMTRIRTLLEADDAQAVTLYRSMRPVLEQAMGSAIAPLNRYIEQYDFEKALETLNQMVTKIPNLAG